MAVSAISRLCEWRYGEYPSPLILYAESCKYLAPGCKPVFPLVLFTRQAVSYTIDVNRLSRFVIARLLDLWRGWLNDGVQWCALCHRWYQVGRVLPLCLIDGQAFRKYSPSRFLSESDTLCPDRYSDSAYQLDYTPLRNARRIRLWQMQKIGIYL